MKEKPDMVKEASKAVIGLASALAKQTESLGRVMEVTEKFIANQQDRYQKLLQIFNSLSDEPSANLEQFFNDAGDTGIDDHFPPDYFLGKKKPKNR